MPFVTPFWGWEGSPTKIDVLKKVGTLILTSVEDLADGCCWGNPQCGASPAALSRQSTTTWAGLTKLRHDHSISTFPFDSGCLKKRCSEPQQLSYHLPLILWMDEIRSHHFDTMVEHNCFFVWYLRWGIDSFQLGSGWKPSTGCTPYAQLRGKLPFQRLVKEIAQAMARFAPAPHAEASVFPAPNSGRYLPATTNMEVQTTPRKATFLERGFVHFHVSCWGVYDTI